MLSGRTLLNHQETSSSAQLPQTSDVMAIDRTDDLPPVIDATVVGEDEAIGDPSVGPSSEAMQVVPAQAPVSLPSITGSVIPTPFEPPQSIVSHELSAPPQSVGSVGEPSLITTLTLDEPSIVTSSSVLESPSLVTPSPLGSPQVTPHQIAISSIIAEPSCHILGSSQVIAPRQFDATPTESVSGATVTPTSAYKL